jgi:hypothetical protein
MARLLGRAMIKGLTIVFRDKGDGIPKQFSTLNQFAY